MTFEGNSWLKAEAVASATGLPALADDSGLCVDVLGGSPGIFSARWAGTDLDGTERDRANVRLLLAQLGDVPDEHRAARFRCAAVLALPDGRSAVAEGHVTGTVVREPVGDNGFGYDPIFTPAGGSMTFGEMEPAAKDAISHRTVAFAKLRAALID